MKVLITGATGYLGGRLARCLASQGHEVHIIVRSEVKFEGIAGCHVDFGDGSRIVEITELLRPEIIYHLAACYIWDHKPIEIKNLISSNILVGIQVAEAATRVGAILVNAGTGFQYKDGERWPVNLYAVTKQAFMDAIDWYVSVKGLRASSIILNDTYGPRDPRKKLFYLLRSAVGATHPIAMSPGEQILDLLYVDDAIAAFLAAGDSNNFNGPGHNRWLASGGVPMSLRDIAFRWSQVTRLNPNISWGGKAYREREVMFPCLIGSPPPGWRPSISMDQGFAMMERDP